MARVIGDENVRGFSISLTRTGTSDWLTLLPYNELRQLRWNADPYNLSPGGSGTSATDPGGYIFAYWLTRWAGIGI
jgi:hypothetical protein